MPAVPTSECYAHADRLRGRVVLITGAGSGFGRATALKFTELGAKVVLGDVDAAGLAETVKQVSAQSGPSSVVSAKCDVTSWDDQVALFETGAKAFGNIDVVLPNAGVSEIGRFDPRLDGDASKLTKPNMKTIDIDLIGVLYTTRIALWYFINDKRADPGLRSIVFTGSMSTFYGSDGVGYGVAKAGILGIMKGIVASCNDLKVRVATVCPYFSSKSCGGLRQQPSSPAARLPHSPPSPPSLFLLLSSILLVHSLRSWTGANDRNQHPRPLLRPPLPCARVRASQRRRQRLRRGHHGPEPQDQLCGIPDSGPVGRLPHGCDGTVVSILEPERAERGRARGGGVR